MRPIILSALASLLLCACSKEAQDHSKITLVIDGKTVLSEKAEGDRLQQFNFKHKPLIDGIMTACKNRAQIADLRQLLETEHKMNTSAEIELETEDGHGTSTKSLLVTKKNWQVTVGEGKFSCSESVAN